MAHGARFINDWGTVQIDQDYLNVGIVEEGVATRGVYSSITTRDLAPLVFYKIPPAANGYYTAAYSMVTGSGSPPKNRLGYTGESGIVSRAPANMEYKVGNVGPANGGPFNGWGMKVWNAAGELAYNSLQKQLQIVAAKTINLIAAGPGTYDTIVLPDYSQDYWVAFPQDVAAADSWYDQAEMMDCHSCGAFWQTGNTLAMCMSTVFQYQLDFLTTAQHQDLFRPTLTYVVAKIV